MLSIGLCLQLPMLEFPMKNFFFTLAARATCWVYLACLSALWFSSLNAHAEVQESTVRLRAQVTNMYGKAIEQEFDVVWLENDVSVKGLKPIAIVMHGRAAIPLKRSTMDISFYKANARWLARLGFRVAVPIRIGYGATGGEDAEDSGNCNQKNYPPGYNAAADQTVVVMQYMQQQPGADKDRVVTIGQSYGGTTAITLASMNPDGLKASINFAGGGGGNAETHPEQPCAPHRLERMFADYGKTARVPTLWIYSENDRWMGSKYPVQWHQAFENAGGTGEYVQFGPSGKDGHGLFTQAPAIWRPKVREFLTQHGLLPVTAQVPSTK